MLTAFFAALSELFARTPTASPMTSREWQAVAPVIRQRSFFSATIENWMEISQEQATLRHAAWWLSLENAPATDNQTSVTLTIPRTNLFRPEILIDLLDKTRKKFTPA